MPAEAASAHLLRPAPLPKPTCVVTSPAASLASTLSFPRAPRCRTATRAQHAWARRCVESWCQQGEHTRTAGPPPLGCHVSRPHGDLTARPLHCPPWFRARSCSPRDGRCCAGSTRGSLRWCARMRRGAQRGCRGGSWGGRWGGGVQDAGSAAGDTWRACLTPDRHPVMRQHTHPALAWPCSLQHRKHCFPARPRRRSGVDGQLGGGLEGQPRQLRRRRQLHRPLISEPPSA